MKHEAAYKFLGRKRHRLDFVAVPVITPIKGYAVVLQLQDSVVGNGNPMSVAAEVFYDLRRTPKWRLAVRHPLFLVEARNE